jgi:ABC-type antimicrobial peptide transport system ATPase subunit
MIEVENLSKRFMVRVRRGWLRRERLAVEAIRGISLDRRDVRAAGAAVVGPAAR